MQDNVQKVVQRESKLKDLSEMADHLQQSSGSFAQCSKKIRMKQQLRYLKYTLMAALTFIVIAFLIVLILYVKYNESQDTPAVEDQANSDA